MTAQEARDVGPGRRDRRKARTTATCAAGVLARNSAEVAKRDCANQGTPSARKRAGHLCTLRPERPLTSAAALTHNCRARMARIVMHIHLRVGFEGLDIFAPQLSQILPRI